MGGAKTKKILDRTLRVYLTAVIIIFAVIFLRLAWLQLINSDLYRTRAESNTMRWVPVVAPRGDCHQPARL
ncbi:MAG: hypothetical protein ACOY3J_05820 [Bacillota bacterium]